ncbi:MAG: deoxyribodipyrimidine photo-lyase [Candidatus Rokubacteria bacterium]|nr:deoxyribodipyrimidine photo-lyase [Candidatus Rokubacteria bacterium]
MSSHPEPGSGRTTVVLFTRDLRVHDHPALSEAADASARVVPLFVLDDALLATRYARPNRLLFLLEALADLDGSLRALGGHLVVRRGDAVREVLAVAQAAGAHWVFASADVSAYARRRERRLAAACAEHGVEFRTFPGVTVVEAGAVRPAGGDHFRVFTPYWHRWRALPLRPLAQPPRRIAVPDGLARGVVPRLSELTVGAASPQVVSGGETLGRARLEAWCRDGLARYPDRHDVVAIEGTSRLSPYLHFGCLSPVEVASRCLARGGSDAFLRQLCWRDFHHQVTAAFPAIAREEYRPRGERWADDAELLASWTAGRTGYPLVDAGMRQLAAEGWMHNRARLITASFLLKDLGLDWRLGARHFLDLLVDGDIANNSGNWQWVAGTGNDTRPNRIFNPVRQALRFDPEGAYVRRWVPELATVTGARVHTPWRLPAAERERLDYCAPLVDHDEAAAAFRRRRST